MLAYSSSSSGSSKLDDISAAYVEVIEDFQQKALQQGSEDPASAEMLQKCEELLPGQVCSLQLIWNSFNKAINHCKLCANQSQGGKHELLT